LWRYLLSDNQPSLPSLLRKPHLLSDNQLNLLSMPRKPQEYLPFLLIILLVVFL